jgi:hypothetical protein
MPFLRVMSRKKSTKEPLISRKNCVQVAQFQGKRERGERGTLFLKFGKGRFEFGGNGRDSAAKDCYLMILISCKMNG